MLKSLMYLNEGMRMKINGESLSIEDVVNVARFGEKVEIEEYSLKKVKEGRKRLEKVIESGRVIYGINTGLGDLVRVRIDDNKIKELQENLIRSHASGVGKYLDDEIVRGAMLIRINTFLKGYSGVRDDVVKKLVQFLNHNITPLVPEMGSVGASGDLAPLAYIALALTGQWKVKYRGNIVDSIVAMKEENIEPLKLVEKEGLALLNGTAMMSSIASIAIYDSYQIMKNALISAAMSFEALKATDLALDERIMLARPHPGQIKVAEILRNLLKDSEIVKKARKEKVQDAYTLRCIPQVYGAVLDTLDFARTVVEREINSTTDNPLIFDEAISGGNFHGEPVALTADYLAIALTDLGNMIERRIARIIDSKLSNLPHFLMENSGLNSGLMIPQYTAAALCNRNKILSYPASADSIPTSANQEDHVSMGMNSAVKLREIVENLKYILSIEFLCVNQALHLSDYSSSAIKTAIKAIDIPKFKRDEIYHIYIQKIKEKIDSNKILKEVEKIIKITL